ncbi:MAG: ABC transporter permease [Candidatus Eisenbacteria bacterium]|nr:ABC transporter permease [Candidatus Eisenbacteria bacterium]
MHGFDLREALRSFRHHRGIATTAIVALTAALTLAGLFLMLAHNATVALQFVGDRREMVVYLRDDVTDSQRDDLVNRLTGLFGSVTYVGKNAAWKDFAQQVGDPQLLEAVDQNPLPASLRVRLRPELLAAPAMALAAKQVGEMPEVEDVRYGAEWVRRLDDITRGLERGALAAGIAVALALILVVYNTIRLTVLARRQPIEIMSRLGATDGFIARPYVIEAVFEALIASVLSLGLLYALQQAAASQISGVVFLPWSWAAAFVGAAVALAWLGASLALSRVLRAVGA